MKRDSMSEIATTPFDIVLKAQTGDPVQIGALYEHYRLGVFRYLYYLLGDPQTAEDLTSEVFLRMIRHLPTYRLQGSPFRAWLYRIARNLAADHFRKASSREQLVMTERFPSEGPGPADIAERGLDSAQLRRALSQLSADQREVLILRFIVELPIAETAAALHKSQDAVKGLQRRGLAALRALLSGWEVENE